MTATNNPNGTNSTTPVSIMDRPLQVLHLEDSSDDRHLVQQWITTQNFAANFISVENERDFIHALKTEEFDIILSDKCLPGFDGVSALHYAREHYPHIPFVFVTGSMGEEAAIDTMRQGATDYVLKDRLSRLIPAVQRAVREAEQEEKRRQAEEKNLEQAALLDVAQDAILVIDMDDRIVYWNKSATRVYGWPASATLGKKAFELLPVNPAQYRAAREAVLATGAWKGELAAFNKGGNDVIVESHWSLMPDREGKPKSIFIIDTDITEQKALEIKFLRAQRMDSIGALAGGIAHDLNNALAPVLMGVELLRECDSKEELDRYTDIIFNNAQRATDLVRQILSFARGSGRQAGPVDMRKLINEIGRMIQETFSKSIHFSIQFPLDELWSVHGEPTELHQILLNLCVNARDAMPDGGNLSVAAKNVEFDAAAAVALGGKPGRYVDISVADSGSGIPPEILHRIFEPFFTTKNHDKGTGLGLSTVSGIVKRCGGIIDIETEQGKGTNFHIYLPALELGRSTTPEAREDSLPSGNGELILVIDDEETVCELAKTILETYGYRVITANNGVNGVARFKERKSEVKLVLTDADMPQMDGLHTLQAIMEIGATVPCIISSGTKWDTEMMRRFDKVRPHKLEKPYRLDQLLTTVAASLATT